MFETWFSRKSRPSLEDVASKLLAIVYDIDMHGHFYDLLKMTEAERKRYCFSTFVLTTELPIVMATSMGRSDLLSVIAGVAALMLSSWASKPSYVRLGDFIVTDYEYTHLPGVLERFGNERVCLKNLQDYNVLWGNLLESSAAIRGEVILNDMSNIVQSSCDPSEQPDALFGLCGARLASYIYAPDSIFHRSIDYRLRQNEIFRSLFKQIYERALLVFCELSRDYKSV